MHLIQNSRFGFNRRNFKSTASYSEQAVYRKIAAFGRGGDITKADRSVLVKLVNLWFYHRGRSGYVEPSHTLLERQLGLSERAVRRAVSKLRESGILTLLGGGRGRGRTAKYGVDLNRMREVMWPDFAIKISGFWTRIADLVKGARMDNAYIEDNKPSCSSRALRLNPGVTFETIMALGRRLRATFETWYDRQAKSNNRLGFSSELVCPATGEVLAHG